MAGVAGEAREEATDKTTTTTITTITITTWVARETSETTTTKISGTRMCNECVIESQKHNLFIFFFLLFFFIFLEVWPHLIYVCIGGLFAMLIRLNG